MTGTSALLPVIAVVAIMVAVAFALGFELGRRARDPHARRGRHDVAAMTTLVRPSAKPPLRVITGGRRVR